MSFRIYPTIPSAPDLGNQQNSYHVNTLNNEYQELVKLRDKYNDKYQKYTKAIEKLFLVNASSSSIAVASGIGSVVTGATVVGIPVSVGLVGLSLVGSIFTGFTIALIKKHQKKLQKIMRLSDIVTSAMAVFEISISESLKNNRIDENEFKMIQGLYFKALNELSEIDRKMGKETRTQFEKSLLEEINQLKNSLKTKNQDSS